MVGERAVNRPNCARGNGQDRARGDMQQALRDPSEQQPRQCRAAPSSDDDHVGVILGRELGDRVSGVSDLAARLLERRPCPVTRELGDLTIDLRLDVALVGVQREASAALARERVLHAVDDGQAAAALGCERLGMSQRPVGGLGAVGCPDDVLVHRFSPLIRLGG